MKARQAIVLVGDIVSDGTKTRDGDREKANLAAKRIKSFSGVIDRIGQLPFSYEDKASTMSTYATPALTFGSELYIPAEVKLRGLGKRAHHVLNARKSSCKRNGVAFTLLTRGHRVNPWQSVRYMAIRTIRRVVGGREDLHKG